MIRARIGGLEGEREREGRAENRRRWRMVAGVGCPATRGATGGTEDGWYRGLKSNFPATGMRGMWAELYINDPDILSDVTEIAVKKLGYWSESRSRDDRSLARSLVLFVHARSHVHTHAREHTCIRTRT